MKNITVVCSCILFLFLSSCHNNHSGDNCHHNTADSLVPIVGITFSGTVTEDTKVKSGFKFTVLNVTNGNTLSNEATSDSKGFYTLNQDVPHTVETKCLPPAGSTDAPLMFLYLDIPAGSKVSEDFRFTSKSIRKSDSLTIFIPAGGYKVTLKDKTDGKIQSYDDADGKHTAPFIVADITHNTFELTLTSPTTGVSKTLPFTLPDLKTGIIVNSTIAPF